MPALLVSQKILSSLPPFFPEEKTVRLATLVKSQDKSLMQSQLKTQLIKLGYELWPYKMAFADFEKLAEEEMADHFLLPLLSPATAETYMRYRELGMKFSDLYSGGAAEYFTFDARNEFLPLMFTVKDKIRDYAFRQVVAMAPQVYQKKVKEYAHTLKKIKKEIEKLFHLAEKETEYPILSEEIRQKAEKFEEDICGLGVMVNLSEIMNAEEFFKERKKHLSQMRGLHLTAEIEIY